MTTVAELETRILSPLRDSTQEFFTEPEMIEYLNMCAMDLAARQRLLRKFVTVLTTSSSLPMTSDMLQVRWVKDPNNVEVTWLDESTFFEYQNRVPQPSDWLATIYNDTIWIHPAVDDGQSWQVGFYAAPELMTQASDTWPLPRLWEEKAVRYCRSECWYKLGEAQMGEHERKCYEEGIRPAEAQTDPQVPGRLNFSREPNVFDNGRDAIHLGG